MPWVLALVRGSSSFDPHTIGVHVRRFSNPTRRQLLGAIAAVSAVATVSAFVVRDPFDRRPNYALAALPVPGSRLPQMRLPMLSGDTMTPETYRGQPVVYALWSLECGVSRAALAGVEQLRVDYAKRGAAVVLLADDGDTIALRRTMRAAGIALPVAYASGTLRRLFDNAKTAPERRNYRVQFGLPSFLVVDANGVVTHRETGIPLDEFRSQRVQLGSVRAKLESLLAVADISQE